MDDISAGARDKLETYLNPQALIDSARGLWAGLLATNGTEFYHRLEKVYFSVLYSILWNWHEVTHAASEAKIPW